MMYHLNFWSAKPSTLFAFLIILGLHTQCSSDDMEEDTEETIDYGATPEEQIQWLDDNGVDYYLDEFGNPYTKGEMLIKFDEARDQDKLDLIIQELAIINEIPEDSIIINECDCGETDLVLLQYEDKLDGNLEPAIGSMGDQDGDDDGLSASASSGVTTSNNYYNSPISQFLNSSGDFPAGFAPPDQGQGQGYLGVNDNRIIIAILDSGFDFDHPSLPEYSNFRLWTPPVGSCYELGYDFVNNSSFAADDHGHGTQVAGVILDALEPYYAPVSLMPLKISDENGAISLWDMFCAMNFAVENGANIINISAGWYGAPNLVIQKLIHDNPDVLFICSAGNEGFDTDRGENFHYPSGFHSLIMGPFIPLLPNVISVGALDEARNDLAGFSNYGKITIGIAAPGENITTITPCDGQDCEFPTTTVSGTSFAAPYAAAVAAAMMQCFGDPGQGIFVNERIDLYNLGLVNSQLLEVATSKELYLPEMLPFIPCLQ